jgi:tetratricopeptide (TPR) repeat protein
MAKKHVALALAWGMALSAGCAGRKAVWSEKGEGPSTQATEAAGDEVAALIAEGDAKWEQRTSAENIQAAIAAWEKAVEAEPNNAELLVKLTRANYFLADGFLRHDDKKYLEVMDLGVKWGERAMVAASPEFEEKMRGGTKYPEAVKVMPKEGVPAMYWYASSLGKWAKKKGFAVLLGQKDNVKATMDRALELDPEYFYGGPHRYFGAYYAIAPSFAGGDLEKSQVHFKKSLEISPAYIGTKVLWAENLATKQQDEEAFDRLLAEVLEAPDDGIPELAPELMVEKQKAKELMQQKNDLF